MNLDGILFFPVTPFDTADRVDEDVLAAHIAGGLAHAPGAVFPACGTGELHALSESEAARVVQVATATVVGRVPVIAGTGGPLGHAIRLARAAAEHPAGRAIDSPERSLS